MSLDDDNLTIKYRKSKINFSVLPTDSFVFKFPAPDPKAVLQVSMEKLLAAVEICLRSANDDTTSPETMGLTLIAKENRLLLFATDDATMSHAKVPIKGTAPERVILPLQFCQQLLSIAKTDKKATLELHDEYAMLTFDKDCYLFGRLIQSSKIIPFEETFARHYNKGTKLIPVPKRLQEVLSLSVNITDGPSQDVFTQMKEVSRTGSTKTELSVKDNILFFSSHSARGKYTDNIKLAAGVTHSDCAVVYISPRRVRDGCEVFDQITVTKDCVIMTGDNAFYLVQCATKPE